MSKPVAGRREATVWALVVVLALALLGWRIADNHPAALHPFASDEGLTGPPAKVGALLVAERPADSTGRRHFVVRIPIGTVYLTVSTPQSDVETTSADDRRPPRGGSFVQVDAALQTATASIPIASLTAADNTMSVSVLTGGRRYPVSSSDNRDVVAVDGDAAQLSVEVAYRGVTQRVDVASGRRSESRAAPLYRPLPHGSAACGTVALPAPLTIVATRTYPLTCAVAWRTVPYAPGRGWAAAGHQWLLAAVTTTGPGAVFRHGRRLDVDNESELAATCGDGSRARAVEARNDLPRGRDTTTLLSCPAAAGTQRLRLTETLAVYDLDNPAVPARWTVAVG